MKMKVLQLLTALLLLLPATRPECQLHTGLHAAQQVDTSPADFTVVVKNNIHNKPSQIYKTSTAYRGILLGGLKRLMNSTSAFTFTYTEDPNYGPYLESVNGLAGSDKDHTYWEILVKIPDDQLIRPDVGIGCIIPNPGDQIILNFTRW